MNREEGTIFFPADIEQVGYSNNIFLSSSRLAWFSLLVITVIMATILFGKRLWYNKILALIVFSSLLIGLTYIFLKFVLNEKEIRRVLENNRAITDTDLSPFWSIHSFDEEKRLIKYYNLKHKAIVRIISSSKTAQAANFEEFSRNQLGQVLDDLGRRDLEIDLNVSTKPYYKEEPFEHLDRLIKEEDNPAVKKITRFIYSSIKTTARLYTDVQVLELEVSSKDQRDIGFLSSLDEYLSDTLGRTLYSNIEQLGLEETREYLSEAVGLTGVSFKELGQKNVVDESISGDNIGWVRAHYNEQGLEVPIGEANSEEKVIF